MNNIALAGLIFTSPSAAFAELKERPRFLFPLIALVAGTALLTLWYYSAVDFEWLKDFLFSSNERIQQMPDAARAKAMSMMSKNFIAASGVIGAAIGLPIAFAAESAYFMLAGKISNVQRSFLHWFSLVCWSGLPALAGMVAGMLLLLTRGTHLQISPYELQLLSLNELLFHLAPGAPGFMLLSQLSLLSFWVWGLCIVGVRAWSNRSWAFSSIFVLLPFAAFYGIWAVFAFKS